MSPNQDPSLEAASSQPEGAEPGTGPQPEPAAQVADELRLSGVEPEPVPTGSTRELPVLPPPRSPLDPQSEGAAIRALRRFHVVGPELNKEDPPWDFLPALMFLFRDPSRVRTKYPLYLFPPQHAEPDNLFEGLRMILERWVSDSAPGPDQARIFKDNFARYERLVRKAMAGELTPQPARPLLATAADALRQELGLEGPPADELGADLDHFLGSVPDGAALLGLSDSVPVFVLLQAVRNQLPPRHMRFRERVHRLLVKLEALLEIEYQKSPESRSAEAVDDALGDVAGRFLDPGALGKVMGAPRGSQPMRPRRRERIGEVIGVLKAYLASDPMPKVTVVHPKQMAASWLRDAEGVRVIHHAEPARIAAEVFDESAERMARLFWAARVAELEVVDEYEPICHSPILTNLSWRDFSVEELRLLPPVVALVTARTLPDRGMTSLSRLLLSGRPVQVLATVQSAGTPGGTPGQGPFSGYRLELGYLGISHREAMVEQSSAARPAHLVESIRRGLKAGRPSLHVIASGLTFGGRYPRLGAWLHAGAAIESRAHPFFRYDPEAGRSWAKRLNFDGNTQPARDWPVYELPCFDSEGQPASLTLGFTFADYALLEPVYHGHFQPVSADCPDDDLVSIGTWVKLGEEELLRKVPTIWAVDSKQRLQRLAVSRKLALSCRDRLGFWHTLQEMAGINNEYARAAAQQARGEALREAARQLDRREQELQAELERVRAEEAGEALGRLASALVGSELAPPPPAPVSPSRFAAAAPGVVAEAERLPETSAAQEEEDDELGFDEPYIDTPLCTSCNDCTAINALLFAYNANKQAYIGDASAGTFAQLVQAAEKCPTRCIHPGKPMNPDEPGLDELLVRAARFK